MDGQMEYCEKTLAEVIHSEKLHETPDRSVPPLPQAFKKLTA